VRVKWVPPQIDSGRDHSGGYFEDPAVAAIRKHFEQVRPKELREQCFRSPLERCWVVMIEKIYRADKNYCIWRAPCGIYRAEGGVPRMNTKTKREQKKDQRIKATHPEQKLKNQRQPHEHEHLETRMFN
jgi:hypothetical protein